MVKPDSTLFVLIFLLASCAFGQSEHRHTTVTVTLSKKESSYALDRPVELDFSVSNSSTQDQQICRYATPIEAFRNDFLIVKDATGEEIDYRGILVKRGPPKREDYLTLSPGDTVTHRFVLTQAYPITKKGIYTIQFLGREDLNRLPDSNVLKITIE